jgi:PAS domain S-box-containing protein
VTEKLDLFKFTTDNAPDAIHWMNSEGGFIYVNEQACRILGYTREELLRLTLWDIDPVYSRERWERDWAHFRHGGGVTTMCLETWHRRKNGVVFPVEVAATHVVGDKVDFHVVFVRDITRRRQVEQQLQLTQAAIDRASISCLWIRSDGRLAYVNHEACRALDYAATEVPGLTISDIDPDLPADAWPDFWAGLLNDKVRTFEATYCRKDGSRFPVEVTANHIEFGGQGYACAYVRDLTEAKRVAVERERLEARLRESQKLEAIGQLAGGVAHDFNNILTAMFGNVELATGEVRAHYPEAARLQEGLHQIERSAQRAAALTRQLLAFSRRQVMRPKVLDLNRMLNEVEKLLRRLITEDIDLRLVRSAAPATVKADPGQLEQVVVNLVVNARDAMPEGGKLTVETGNAVLDEAYVASHPEAKAGAHVLLAVSNTGTGIEPETLKHIFEPFFTTKPLGQGTGLGLSTVYGIVKQAGGHVSVYSEVGQGSTFRVYLPLVPAAPEVVAAEERERILPTGTETILVCEDDLAVRDLTARMLREAGYCVLEARRPRDALQLAAEHDGPLHLLVTDVIMPELNGRKLAAAITARRPDVRTLYVSGYTSNVIAHHGVLDSGVEFLAKPFSRRQLLERVREVLDRETPSA